MWHEFRETETVYGRTLEVERGSCSLVLGLSGLDRGGGWTSLAMAGARGADIGTRFSVQRGWSRAEISPEINLRSG